MAANVGSVIKLAIKHGPKIGVAAAAVGGFLSKNPEVATWARERLKHLADVPARRGDAAQIRGMLDAVRDVAGKLRTDGPAGDAAAGWLKRAEDIDLAVQLAEQLGQPERRQALARLRGRAKALLDELIEATTA